MIKKIIESFKNFEKITYKIMCVQRKKENHKGGKQMKNKKRNYTNSINNNNNCNANISRGNSNNCYKW